MKINDYKSPNKQSFKSYAAKQYVTENMRQNASVLLKRMNKNISCKINEEGTRYTANILASIEDKAENIKFINDEMLVSNAVKSKGLCTLYTGKNRITMNAVTGEVIGHNKSFFKSWKLLLLQTEDILTYLVKNFDNPQIIKNFFQTVNYTKKGYELRRAGKLNYNI